MNAGVRLIEMMLRTSGERDRRAFKIFGSRGTARPETELVEAVDDVDACDACCSA
jgi:hypothetical protein